MQHRTMTIGIAAAALFGLTWAPAAASRPAEPALPAQSRPATPDTRYALVQVAGKPLPAQVEKEWRCREDVTAGSLTLSGDNRWLLETTTREVCGDRSEEDRDTEDGMYRTEGNTIRFLDEDGREDTDRDWGTGSDSDIDLDDLSTGTSAADGTLRVQLADGRTTLLFRR